MKAIFKNKIIIAVLAVILTLGAGGTIWAIVANSNSRSNKLLVYASFYPVYDFTKKVGGEKVEVINLVPAGQEAHHYEPTTKQMAGLYEADLIVINGAGMESWLENLNSKIQNKILDTSAGVELLERNGGAQHEHEHSHGQYDPHIWLSLANAKIQMTNIKNKLVALDSENASYYEANFLAYSRMFTSLQNDYEQTLSAAAGKTIVVSHGAFGYLTHEFGLKQKSFSGIEAEEEPETHAMSEIINYIRDNGITTIFYQSLVNAKVAEQIARETTAKVLPLSTVEGLTSAQLNAGQDYLFVMTQNLIALQQALV